MKHVSAFAALASCLTLLAACKEKVETPVPSPTSSAVPQTSSGGFSSVLNRINSDAPKVEVTNGIDPAAQNISPFRGIYSPDARAAYEAEYLKIKDVPGARDKYLKDTRTSITNLRLAFGLDAYIYVLDCAAALDVRGRLGQAKVMEAQYNSKFWMYSAFAELDARHRGSVGGLPEQVPGIEKFPDKKVEFDPGPFVEPYRLQTYINYRFIRDEALKKANQALTLGRAKKCDEVNPPEIEHYGGWSFTLD